MNENGGPSPGESGGPAPGGRPLPTVVSRWLETHGLARRGGPSPGAAEAGSPDETQPANPGFMPSPQAAAVAVMALLAFGVILGSLGNHIAQSAGVSTIVLEEPEEAPPAPTPAAPVQEAEPEQVSAPVLATTTAPLPIPLPEEPVEEASGEDPPAQLPPELPPEPGLPPVSHVFLIVLHEQGYEKTFGAESTSPYFSQVLPAQGELLANYYAVAQGDLANEVALLSGQGPTPQTSANCPEYAPIAPATTGLGEQVEGAGCLYPPAATTVLDQLAEAKKPWKAYVEQPEEASAPPCTPNWRNPTGYFGSLLGEGGCAERNAGLTGLSADLKSVKGAPALSYIVPDACHDGSQLPCAPGQPAGLEGAEAFLVKVVPEIEASPSFTAAGLIAITFAQAPQVGPEADQSSCCATPEYPNLAAAPPPAPIAAEGPVKPTGGGGRVGMVLISPYVTPGSVDEAGYYNHFSMLRSVEELFGLPALGYAAEPAVAPFDETVYNNLET